MYDYLFLVTLVFSNFCFFLISSSKKYAHFFPLLFFLSQFKNQFHHSFFCCFYIKVTIVHFLEDMFLLVLCLFYKKKAMNDNSRQKCLLLKTKTSKKFFVFSPRERKQNKCIKEITVNPQHHHHSCLKHLHHHLKL